MQIILSVIVLLSGQGALDSYHLYMDQDHLDSLYADSLFDTGTVDMGFHHGPPSDWLSIEDQVTDPLPSLIVSPSPTYGILVLYCGGDILERAQVYDMTGREICSTDSPAEEVQLNLPEDLPSGVYLARAKVLGSWLTAKLVLINR